MHDDRLGSLSEGAFQVHEGDHAGSHSYENTELIFDKYVAKAIKYKAISHYFVIQAVHS
jgi:hypothetical protein